MIWARVVWVGEAGGEGGSVVVVVVSAERTGEGIDGMVPRVEDVRVGESGGVRGMVVGDGMAFGELYEGGGVS